MSQLKNYLVLIFNHTNLSWILVLNAIYLFWIGVAMPYFAAISSNNVTPAPLDLSFAYTANEAFSRVAEFSDIGRKNYMAFLLTADIIYPIIYTASLSFTIAYLAKKSAIAMQLALRLTALPLAIFTLDILENLSISILLWSYPSKFIPLGWSASIFTTLKWTCVLMAFIAIVWLLLRVILNGLRGSKSLPPSS